jgi:type IV pilus assembly protein PilM
LSAKAVNQLALTEILQRWIADPPPDYLFEVTPGSFACVSPRLPAEQRRELLPEPGLAASPSAPNLLKPELYRQALPKLVPPSKNRRPATALVIPDYAARIAILDFEEFPAKEEDRRELLRFRLRKSVPFPIDEAQLAYSIQLQNATHVEVLAVAIARPILNEYESILVDAGYRLGLVVPSSIAALPLCGAENGLTLLVKAAGPTLSVLLLEKNRICLVRSIDFTGEESEFDRPAPRVVLPLLQQTLAYCEDQLGQPAARMLLCGFGPETDALGQAAELEFRLPCIPLRSRFGIASQENAGLLGLLEQYAA